MIKWHAQKLVDIVTWGRCNFKIFLGQPSQLPTDSLKQLWNPFDVLAHENGDIGSISMDESLKILKVKLTGSPIVIDAEKSYENIVFPGDLGMLKLRIRNVQN